MAERVVKRAGDGLPVLRDTGTGKIRGADGITDRQAAFARLVGDGMSPVPAAREAGYATPAPEAYRLLRTPLVAAMIERRRLRRLAQGASLSLSYLQSVVTGADHDPRLRVKAAIALIAADQAAMAREQQRRQAAENPDASLSVMSLAEMQEHARKLIQRIEKSKVIEHSPDPVAIDAMADRLAAGAVEDVQPVEKTGFSVPSVGTKDATGAERADE